ncbi:pyridoxamine 5'-phosphate oxidase family protein [Lutimaribacter sp. EGI FJ00015]|uniref:Pyridoxamine 5'-phosphate oxidase family protein n=1 Tax=Lutimaribacter degradans TaxID=2945989 RepID=A0ACC5ZZI0_9RHOB|nr:pyridoxamine 5'-phosphate oxidase family protein [Lutimaribacter sp. EGI FJ00013]MCM2563457.1 pyridoxamine 5'-phosphate oxidase family protein [Lutimaribacter sp. EGI FJ00013]MCO0614637.1 pyridoxamine 5'-phosphate oxidase family protein [Lutimaribacter sp. EGI FJ00015]MCO0637308.1 pyridoxamine 5'-phosphate oxidase family protein [Lutimaribacter sp. EGI FJ00014]
MQAIKDIETLETLYGAPSDAALRKVARRMTPGYRRWVAASRFCVLATVGPEGVDASPRGDDGPVVAELDPGTLAMPDWRGNNRLDSLRNIIRDGRVALMFMVPGEATVVRVNGHAVLTDDAHLRDRFAQKGRLPATVIVITIDEVYSQCPKSVIRSGLWSRDDGDQVPSLGDILAEMTGGDIDAAEWEKTYPTRARDTLW